MLKKRNLAVSLTALCSLSGCADAKTANDPCGVVGEWVRVAITPNLNSTNPRTRQDYSQQSYHVKFKNGSLTSGANFNLNERDRLTFSETGKISGGKRGGLSIGGGEHAANWKCEGSGSIIVSTPPDEFAIAERTRVYGQSLLVLERDGIYYARYHSDLEMLKERFLGAMKARQAARGESAKQ